MGIWIIAGRMIGLNLECEEKFKILKKLKTLKKGTKS
jgi:hypothetical protein